VIDLKRPPIRLRGHAVLALNRVFPRLRDIVRTVPVRKVEAQMTAFVSPLE
jgi:hypothetical protein